MKEMRGAKDRALLELAQPEARDGSCNKNRMKKMKHGPQQSAAHQGHVTELDHKGGRLLAWIGGQVRLKAFTAQQGSFIYRREAEPCAKPGTMASP